MAIKVAINGFGRIGSLVLAAMEEQEVLGSQFDMVAAVLLPRRNISPIN